MPLVTLEPRQGMPHEEVQMRPALVTALIVGSISLALPLSALGHSPTGDRVLTAFPTDQVFEQWRVLEATLFNKAHIHATLKVVQFNPADGPDKPLKAPLTRHWKVDQNGDAFLVQIAAERGPFDQVLGRNPKYAFEILRPGEEGKIRKVIRKAHKNQRKNNC